MCSMINSKIFTAVLPITGLELLDILYTTSSTILYSALLAISDTSELQEKESSKEEHILGLFLHHH